MIDVNTVLTPRQIAGLTQVGEDNPLILAYATEREVLLAALAEFEAQWGDYGNIQYCQACRNIGEARRFYGDQLEPLVAMTFMPHKDYCAHAIAEAILNRAMGE